MPRLIVPAAILMSFLCFGCEEPSLVGGWVSEGVASRTIELSSDGRAKFTVEAGLQVALEGDYRVSGNRIVVTGIKPLPDVDVPDFARGLLPTKIEATVSWKNAQEIVLSGDRFLEGGYRRKQ